VLSHPRIYADAGEGPSEELPADLMMGNCCTHRKTDAMTRRPAAETRAPSAIDLSQNAKAASGPPGFKRAPSLTTGLARVPSLTRASSTGSTRSSGSFSAPKSGEAPKSANEKKTQATDAPKTKRQSLQKSSGPGRRSSGACKSEEAFDRELEWSRQKATREYY
jgi:hypothetical protein